MDKRQDNYPPVSFTSSVTTFDADAYLASEGVPLDKPVNATFRSASRAVEDLPKAMSGTVMTAEEARRRLPILDALYNALIKAKKTGASEKVIQHSEGILAAGTVAITSVKGDVIR